MTEITRDVFAAWAWAVGIRASAEHLDRLRAEVQDMMGRLQQLDEIDVSGVAPEEVGLRHDGGAL